MDHTLLICLTILASIGIYCSYKFKTSKAPKIPSPQDQCAHDMKVHIEFEDDFEKVVISVCTKCGFEREYNFDK